MHDRLHRFQKDNFEHFASYVICVYRIHCKCSPDRADKGHPTVHPITFPVALNPSLTIKRSTASQPTTPEHAQSSRAGQMELVFRTTAIQLADR
jgi:hypothetical protein